MADHIPFVSSDAACRLVAKHYADSKYVRVPLNEASHFRPRLPANISLWVDPQVDGLDDLRHRRARKNASTKDVKATPWYECIDRFPHATRLAEDAFRERPDKRIVDEFVEDVLGKCAPASPRWITVPQLPVGTGTSRNKVNRQLASAAGAWKGKSGCSASFVLPLIFTHQGQYKLKSQRTPNLRAASTCYKASQAEVVWVVDASLDDESGARTLRNERFPAVVSLHMELAEKLPEAIRVAGPYWGLNLVLWARGLVDYPAIGIGNAYQYSLSGGPMRPPRERLPLGPLRRRCGVDPQVGGWLDHVLSRLGRSHPAHAELERMRRYFTALRPRPSAREQVAAFYKRWFDSIADSPPEGRALSLFQDLSAAYALGKPLGPIPGERGLARRPEAVAEPLMLSCL